MKAKNRTGIVSKLGAAIGVFAASALIFTCWAGSISGTVIENIENRYGVDVALVDGNGVLLELVGPDRSVTSTVSASGAYAFTGLAAGDYQLTAYSRSGKTASATIPVSAGGDTDANVVLIARKEAEVYVYFAAMGVDEGEASPDVTLDGFIDNQDLAEVTEGFGESVEDYPLLDVNQDGSINQADADKVTSSLGKVVLAMDHHYQAQVTPGGSVAVIGDGLATVRSESGRSTGIVDWAPALQPTPVIRDVKPMGDSAAVAEQTVQMPVNKKRVRFTITEDIGVASSPELGLFSFAENPDDLTWIDVSLKTGRVKGGRIGLTLTNGAFSDPVSIAGEVADGVIAFSPGGFALYHVVNVAGEFGDDFPMFPGEAFVMGKCDPPKESKDCDSSMVTNATCTKPITGGTGTCLIGFACDNEGADCVVDGSCNKCVTHCRVGGGCDCWCLP
ncbi:hypothetical protein ABI59_22340 [Acidobacteria bacterium Mor1]|nr:hypothetical protein ABI59_22340 [Acidobacteria bacterium Mor1]